MKSRFKSNNYIALLIAIILMVIGFVLGFINKQSESAEKQKQTESPVAMITSQDSSFTHHFFTIRSS